MKKLLILSALLIFACSSDSSDSEYNVSIEGEWNLFSLTVCGVPIELIGCDVKEYFLLDNGNGTSYNFSDQNDQGSIPCQIDSTTNFTYVSVPNTNTYEFLVDGVISVGTLNGNTLTFIEDMLPLDEEDEDFCEQQEGAPTKITVWIKD